MQLALRCYELSCVAFRGLQEHDACPTRNHKDQADPAALADEQQTLAHHRAATHMLEVVAAKRDPQRKGKLVLTATYSTAVSAGAESVRPRLLITEVSVYVNSAANSLMALDQANQLMGKMRLPGKQCYLFLGSRVIIWCLVSSILLSQWLGAGCNFGSS